MAATTPIDRSTGPARGRLRDAGGALGRHGRRLLLLGAAILLAACSQLKLGYNHADTLLAYSLDSYLKLDDEQKKLARGSIAELHRWHRSTQLAAYAALLNDAQAKVAGPVTAADVLEFNAGVNRLLAAIGDRAAPDLAQLALTLKPAQVERLAERLANDTSKARRELVRFAGPESAQQRVDRYVQQAEEWFGRLRPEQRALIRDALARQPEAQELWMAERERRQRELVAVMARIGAEQPEPQAAAAWIRDYFAQLAVPTDPERRARLAQARQANAELVAQLINSASPAQRAAVQKKLRGYAADFDALAAQGAEARG